MDIRPILSTLLRHKTAATLIVLEIALSCAIICNAIFLITTRLERMKRPTGLAETELVSIQMAGIGRSDDPDALVKRDLAALRAIPGVKAATSTNQVPFGGSSSNSSISLEPDQLNPTVSASIYLADEGLLDTFGLRLVEGRWFNADEFLDRGVLDDAGPEIPISATVLTRSLAERLFPGESAIGKSIYSWGEAPTRVVGVVEYLMRPNDIGGAAENQFSFILPVRPTSGTFALRTAPERRAEVLETALEALGQVNPRRIVIWDRTFTEMASDYYRQDRAMAGMLVAMIVALLVVTALGIVGLASFWVAQRTKQIGVRRALGATRGQVLRYFQTENFLLASFGIVLGMLGAYGLNQFLMGQYEMERLPAIYLPLGAVALWLLGQVAVFGPARRAAAVPPAVATRSV